MNNVYSTTTHLYIYRRQCPVRNIIINMWTFLDYYHIYIHTFILTSGRKKYLKICIFTLNCKITIKYIISQILLYWNDKEIFSPINLKNSFLSNIRNIIRSKIIEIISSLFKYSQLFPQYERYLLSPTSKTIMSTQTHHIYIYRRQCPVRNIIINM